MCLQSLVSFCQFVLKILSKNQILISIKGRNSVANLQKTIIYNTNVDLVNDNVCIQNLVLSLLKFELIQAFMHVLNTCKNEEDQIKNDAQGQLTPQSLVRSGRISNSFEMLYMSWLPASMKKIQSKMKALEWTQHFPHYNPMGAICCHGNQSSNPTWSKT